MRSRFRRAWLVTLLLAGWSRLGGSTAQVAHQHHPESIPEYIRALEDPGRDAWQKPAQVIEKLALKPGETVADLGAGSGYFTILLARAVRPAGKVYAIDIEPQMLEYIDQRAKKEKLTNIQTILADPHDPKLHQASVDMIFICNTLHHVSERGTYYPLLARALKPGGCLVDIDFQKRDLPIGPPLSMKIAKRDVAKEVAPAGFRLTEEFDFLEYQYFLVFSR